MITYDPREVAMLVRDALIVKQERDAARPVTLIDELEQEAATSLRAVQNLIDGMARQRRLYIANGMREAVAAGANVGGTYSLARWREIQEVFDAFEQWLQTPLAECGIPPLVVVSRRGNPAEPEPEPTPEEPAA